MSLLDAQTESKNLTLSSLVKSKLTNAFEWGASVWKQVNEHFAINHQYTGSMIITAKVSIIVLVKVGLANSD